MTESGVDFLSLTLPWGKFKDLSYPCLDLLVFLNSVFQGPNQSLQTNS